VPPDLFLAHFVEPDEIVQVGHLQPAALDQLLASRKTGSPIDGAERLVVAADDGDGDVCILGLTQEERGE
jgi:hypothetical protein